MARASASEETAPPAMAWMRMFPAAVASTGPVMTFRPVALAAHWLRSSLRVPPPTMWRRLIGLPVSCSSSERLLR